MWVAAVLIGQCVHKARGHKYHRVPNLTEFRSTTNDFQIYLPYSQKYTEYLDYYNVRGTFYVYHVPGFRISLCLALSQTYVQLFLLYIMHFKSAHTIHIGILVKIESVNRILN